MANIIYHIFIIILAAITAISLPNIVRYGAQKFIEFWYIIENEKIFLVGLEIIVAIGLISIFSFVGNYLKTRKIANAAQALGIIKMSSPTKIFSKSRVKRSKEKQGLRRELMIIGSTGHHTFVSHESELHRVLLDCRESRILLLDPFSEGARQRAMSLKDPKITPETFKDQIIRTIGYLEELSSTKANIRLKLYPDLPLMKLIILGDYLYVKNYPPGMNARDMHEFVIKHNKKFDGLYDILCRYFLSFWNDNQLPEYDFVTGDLVYRDRSENELKRIKFDEYEKYYEQNRNILNNMKQHN